VTPGAARWRWSRPEVAALVGVTFLGVAIRVALLPTPGLRGDLDQFVGWVHAIATHGLGNLYGENPAGPVTFGPVMAYVWAVLAAIQPAFRVATDASDPAIRELMKLPASVADIGLALVVAYFLRARPAWAVVGAAAILLHPAIIDVSAWWGQYESIYVLAALAAAVLAISGRNGLAAAAIAVSLTTKPQALPLLVPFAAWFWATGYRRGALRGAVKEIARTGAIGLLVVGLTWLPFIGANGPQNYLHNLGVYQEDVFNFLSLRAWNVWWLVEMAAAGGRFIADDVAILGGFTLRDVGYVVVGLLELAIGVAIIRDPRPQTLILGLAAAVLVTFSFATQMHERYAYGAVVFLTLLIAEPRARALGLALGVVFTLNLLSAIPPTPEVGQLLRVDGLLGVVGSIGVLAITYGSLRLLAAGGRDRHGSLELSRSSRDGTTTAS
jgi:hypothetical protein